MEKEPKEKTSSENSDLYGDIIIPENTMISTFNQKIIQGPECINCLLYLPTKNKIVVTSFHKDLLFYDDTFTNITNRIETNRYGNKSLCYIKDTLIPNKEEEYLGVGSYKNIYIISLDNYTIVLNIEDHDDWIHSLNYSSDDHYLFTGCNELKVFKLSKIEEESKLKNELIFTSEREENTIKNLLLIKPNLNTLAAGWASTKLSIFDLENFEKKGQLAFNDCFFDAMIQSDDNHFIIGTWHGSVMIYSLETNSIENEIKIDKVPILCMSLLSENLLFYFVANHRPGILNIKYEQKNLNLQISNEIGTFNNLLNIADCVIIPKNKKIYLGYGVNHILEIEIV